MSCRGLAKVVSKVAQLSVMTVEQLEELNERLMSQAPDLGHELSTVHLIYYNLSLIKSISLCNKQSPAAKIKRPGQAGLAPVGPGPEDGFEPRHNRPVLYMPRCSVRKTVSNHFRHRD